MLICTGLIHSRNKLHKVLLLTPPLCMIRLQGKFLIRPTKCNIPGIEDNDIVHQRQDARFKVYLVTMSVVEN